MTATNTRPAQASQYLTFRLGAEEYAIGILRVQEIRSFEQPTHVADAPPHVLGVVNLRGVIVPIVDLRRKFGCPDKFDAMTVVIILNFKDSVVGVVVDSVSDVIELTADDIQPAPPVTLNSSAASRLITSIGCSGDRMLLLTDIDTMLAGVPVPESAS